MGKLRALSISYCNVKDDGLAGIATHCRQLRFLNMENCEQVSDSGVIAIAKRCHQLRLLNLTGCNIRNKSLFAIAENCHELTSINLCRCVKVTDKGLQMLGRGCPKLQAVNLVSVVKITEAAMVALAQSCKGLLMLNLTGCENITVNGLKALIHGLKYVDEGRSFFGFQPKDRHVELKLRDNLHMIRDSAEEAIRQDAARKKARLDAAERERTMRCDNAARVIQRAIRMHTKLGFYRNLIRQTILSKHAKFIQRVWRGTSGRNFVKYVREELARFLSRTPHAIRMQSAVRGHLCRIRQENQIIYRRIRDMYTSRIRDAESGAVVPIQAMARRFLAKRRVAVWGEVFRRRAIDKYNAATLIQKRARVMVCKILINRMRVEILMRKQLEERMGLVIKNFIRRQYERWLAKLKGQELLRAQARRVRGTLTLQRCYRGFKTRENTQRLRIERAGLYMAAMTIQRYFRGSRILNWKDIRRNAIAAFVLDRHHLERGSSIERARHRYRQYMEENRRDSASEDDDVEREFHWQKGYDPERRREYWHDNNTGEIRYEEPHVPFEHEKSLVGMRLQVYWNVQKEWYQGTITKFHRRKHRHRIEYDDGDHEWIDLDMEHDRIQLQLEDGTWIVYLQYRSAGQDHELKRLDDLRQIELHKKKAFQDANQWMIISADTDGAIMFMSTRTGETRTGTPDAYSWSVQDDGHGYPCFLNVDTGETVFDDPRFEDEESIDLITQRAFVMNEIRYAMYFCEGFSQRYTYAMEQNDEREMKNISLQVINSPRPKHLSSFLLRAQALFKPTSIVDAPQNETIMQELEYANWMSGRMADIGYAGSEVAQERRVAKTRLMEKFVGRKKENVLCPTCGIETEKQLEFCPGCGRKQVFL
jgi:hypothetical protein